MLDLSADKPILGTDNHAHPKYAISVYTAGNKRGNFQRVRSRRNCTTQLRAQRDRNTKDGLILRTLRILPLRFGRVIGSQRPVIAEPTASSDRVLLIARKQWGQPLSEEPSPPHLLRPRTPFQEFLQMTLRGGVPD